MTDALTIGWTAAQARSWRRIFQRILGFNMAAEPVVIACGGGLTSLS